MFKKYRRARLIRWRGLWYALGLCLTIQLMGGIGFWMLEPTAKAFAGGLWQTFTTAATVGYGALVRERAQLRAEMRQVRAEVIAHQVELRATTG